MSNPQTRKLRYSFREGRKYTVKADVVGKELARITKRDGVLQARVVVDESRADDAPLHSVFEWDDSVAGDHWRTAQARNLIRSIQVEYPDNEPAEPVYVNVPDVTSETKGPGYYPTRIVASQPDMYASALNGLLGVIKQAEESVRKLRTAAENDAKSDANRMSLISVALEAINTASSAVQALH